jgi:hypothetical protein
MGAKTVQAGVGAVHVKMWKEGRMDCLESCGLMVEDGECASGIRGWRPGMVCLMQPKRTV